MGSGLINKRLAAAAECGAREKGRKEKREKREVKEGAQNTVAEKRR